MKKISLYIFFLQFIAITGFSQQKDLDIITNKLVEKQMNVDFDQDMLENNLTTMNQDGSWNDINYENSQANTHLNRLINMTLAYRKTGNKYTNSNELLNKIMFGLDYFFKKKPVNSNWWYNDIGFPQKYAVILILLKNKIDNERLYHYSSYLQDKTGNQAHKGKNRTWVSEITIYKGCIENNPTLLTIGFNSIVSTIKIVDYHEIEGIKIDNSIHQHRPQLYSGGYGMSFIADLAEYINLSRGTSFRQLFTPEKIKLISDVMLDGIQLFGYRKSFDFGTIGRNISRPDGPKNVSVELLDLMTSIDSGNKEAYILWKNHLNGAPFPQKGNKYFWKSDIMVHHGDNYYLSAKVISVRTNGTECLNGENLKGYYLPLGTTNIMTSGNEYENIFPIWDWTRIPGTTSVSSQDAATLTWYHFGSNKYAGGVSNRKNGCIAFEHIYNGVEAKKAYFFIQDAMLCLGSGITAYKTNNIVTTVNQCYAKGDIYFRENGKTHQLSQQKKDFDNTVDWVHHDNVGYIFPNKGKISVQKKEQTGSWSLISKSDTFQKISGNIFTLWADHGNEPQADNYCYIIMPGISLDNLEIKAQNHGFIIIKNDDNIQAVRNDISETYAIVFYEPDSVVLDKNLEITSDKKAIVLIEKTKDGYEISVSDPLYKASEINLTVNKQPVNFKLPQGEYLGSTVKQTIKISK